LLSGIGFGDQQLNMLVIIPTMRIALGALILLMPCLTSARPSIIHTTRDLFPESPATDPFYQPPEGFESTAPGTILKQRSVVAAIFSIIPDPVEAHQLLYRTTAINGSAIATVTTVFKPLGAPKTDRFISFHTAYDSSAPICNPSYNYLLGSLPVSVIATVERLLIEAYLILGYIVASPDYEGPDAAFAVGRLEGMGVLDGMRAVKNYGNTLCFTTDDPMIVGTGYSGGAIATGWAASLQPSYASELNIKGWAHGGTPANLTGVLKTIDRTIFAGFSPAAVVGLSAPSAYLAQLTSLLDSIVTDDGREALEFAAENCAVFDLFAFAGKSLLSTKFQSLGEGLLYNPIVVDVLEKNTIGLEASETPKAPVFTYHATQDEIIPYANASTMVDSWCKNGADVKFTTFEAGGHATTEILAFPEAVKFVEDAFAGKTSAGCTRDSELTNSLDPLALGVNLEPILVQLVDALFTLGDQDSNLVNNIGILNGGI
jgi:hypothetical protein